MPILPMVTDMVDVKKCTPAFAGLRYCTTLQYVDAFSHNSAPYFPFTGDSRSVRYVYIYICVYIYIYIYIYIYTHIYI